MVAGDIDTLEKNEYLWDSSRRRQTIFVDYTRSVVRSQRDERRERMREMTIQFDQATEHFPVRIWAEI